ncbi:MAG: hypothetical protein NT075_23065 [Chloroflexi bacterium]|nr:hypothetical protein [Chloroflexota bacterium]
MSDATLARELGVTLFTLLLTAAQFLYLYLTLLNGEHCTTDDLTCQYPVLMALRMSDEACKADDTRSSTSTPAAHPQPITLNGVIK